MLGWLKAIAKALGKTVLILLVVGAAGWAGYQVYEQQRAARAESDAGRSTRQVVAARRIPVVLTPVGRRVFERRVVVQGNVEAKHTALVSPRVGGTIEALYVDEGDRVAAGRTKLFQIDALKLQKAVEMRKGELAVTQCSRREKEANLEKERVLLEKAELDFQRFRQLFERKVVSESALDGYQAAVKEGRALCKHAASLVDLAAAQERQAVVAVAVAEKDLRDALVVSPINGLVSQRFQEPGEMGAVGKPVLRIDDLSVLEVSAFLPAACYPHIVPGKVRMRVQAGGVDLGERPVSYRSPTVDAKLRTFEVKCLVENPPEGVAPGAMAEVAVVLEHREALGLPQGAVVRRGGRHVVFTIDGGRARMVPVATGLETDGWIELKGGELREGTPAVSMGQFLLDDGTGVAVQKGSE